MSRSPNELRVVNRCRAYFRRKMCFRSGPNSLKRLDPARAITLKFPARMPLGQGRRGADARWSRRSTAVDPRHGRNIEYPIAGIVVRQDGPLERKPRPAQAASATLAAVVAGVVTERGGPRGVNRAADATARGGTWERRTRSPAMPQQRRARHPPFPLPAIPLRT